MNKNPTPLPPFSATAAAWPPLSVLDLAHVPEGATPAEALRRARRLAQHAEGLGYRRFWMAEHHNMAGVASSATAVALGFVAEGTKTIRIGSGGVMLPNHAPLVIAEQFGTLAALYPGRVDLGLGRAPGTDQLTIQALRVDPMGAERFPQDVAELAGYFQPPAEGQRVMAVPGAGLEVPLWILGSSLYGAQVAAHYGLPFGFAAHFAPKALEAALQIYRQRYQPSPANPAPYALVCVNAIVASTDDEAAMLATSLQQAFLGLVRNRRGLFPRPVPTMDGLWTELEQAHVGQMLTHTYVGTPARVAAGLAALRAELAPDELMVTAPIWDEAARTRSFQLLAEAWAKAGAEAMSLA